MSKLRKPFATADFQVMSLEVQARVAVPAQERSSFEVLVRHLFDRLLNNEAFGEDTAARMTQLAFTIALPGLLVALFLFPMYHQPIARSYWSQTCDQFFYVVYSFVVMGAATVFQADLFFPDLTDIYVLTTLPTPHRKLLLARVAALALFLALVLAETSLLGAVFYPASADLPFGFWKHFATHCIAVAVSGAFAAAFFIGLQGVLVCVLGRRLFRSFSPLVQALSMAVLLTVMSLDPLLAHYLRAILTSNGSVIYCFPPFWFLGIYERLLWGKAALPVFTHLAMTGLWATLLATFLAVVSYPIAYTLRTKQLIEGTSLKHGSSRVAHILRVVLHFILLREPKTRAVYHFIGQTIFRTKRLQLYLAMYAGVGAALVISGIVRFGIGGRHIHLLVAEEGIRMAVPVVAFWTIAGFRTAIQSPVNRPASWISPIIHGSPEVEHLAAMRRWALVSGLMLTLTMAALLRWIAPAPMHTMKALAAQVLVAVGLCLLLTDFFFLRTRKMPFTETRISATVDLPVILVRYFIGFPIFVFAVIDSEPWIESSVGHLLVTAVLIGIAHYALGLLRGRLFDMQKGRPETDESLLQPLVLLD